MRKSPTASYWQSALWGTFYFVCGILCTVATMVIFEIGWEVIFDTAVAQDPSSVAAEDSGLRYTTLGWQDPTKWLAQPQQGSQLNLGSVNPLIWAAMIVLAVGIAVMWLSSDDEVERIFKERLEKAELAREWESKNGLD